MNNVLLSYLRYMCLLRKSDKEAARMAGHSSEEYTAFMRRRAERAGRHFVHHNRPTRIRPA